MDKNNYELMNLTHIGKSFTALGFNANLKIICHLGQRQCRQ